MFDASAIVLAGGRSSRMGSPKAALDWHGSTLLRRVTGIVARVVDGPVVVVRAPGQELPALPAAVEVVDDPREGRGPMQGLAAGLAAIGDRAAVAYVSSTDVPFLHPAFVRRVLMSFDDAVDVVLPEIGGYRQPMAAGYRVGLLAIVEELVAADRLRPAFLFERCRVRGLSDAAMLSDAGVFGGDPELASARNLNDPADYERARRVPPPAIEVERSGLASGHGPRRQTAHAWTLGALAVGLDLTLDEQVVVTLNGDQIARDPELPLAAGDAVGFMPADARG